MSKSQIRRTAFLAVAAGLAVTLAGCESFREAAGLTKEAPDEFAVATKAPLIIPPDYNLRPPKPGAAPTNQVSPTDSAEDSLFGDPAPVTSSRGQLSAGEQEILAKAGASNSNDMIRQKITAENKSMQAADESFTNRLLFETPGDSSAGTPVDADAEKKRLETATNGGQKPADDAKPAENSTTKKDSGGWFDGIFDGIF